MIPIFVAALADVIHEAEGEMEDCSEARRAELKKAMIVLTATWPEAMAAARREADSRKSQVT